MIPEEGENAAEWFLLVRRVVKRTIDKPVANARSVTATMLASELV